MHVLMMIINVFVELINFIVLSAHFVIVLQLQLELALHFALKRGKQAVLVELLIY